MKVRDLCEELIALCAQGYGHADTDVVHVELAKSEDRTIWNDEVMVTLR